MSLPSADSVWPGEDRHHRLEVQHPPEALHPRQQHRQVVLESRGVVRWGEEGPAAAVCYRLIQSPTARLQSFTGYWSDWLTDWLTVCVCVCVCVCVLTCFSERGLYFQLWFSQSHFRELRSWPSSGLAFVPLSFPAQFLKTLKHYTVLCIILTS